MSTLGAMSKSRVSKLLFVSLGVDVVCVGVGVGVGVGVVVGVVMLCEKRAY